ncbi:MAG: hypothetical protein ABR909_04810 [Candidatus Bathyarchaeia archaeon]|jgi:hypothetical protein
MADNEETVKLLKEISSKLDNLNDKKDDRDFQLEMLKVQTKQNSFIFFISVLVSFTASVFIAFFTVAFTVPNIPTSIVNLAFRLVVFVWLISDVIFFIIWFLIRYMQNREIDKLKKLNDSKP